MTVKSTRNPVSKAVRLNWAIRSRTCISEPLITLPVGRRWDIDNAEAMMALEALYQSNGLWDKYWANALWSYNQKLWMMTRQ